MSHNYLLALIIGQKPEDWLILIQCDLMTLFLNKAAFTGTGAQYISFGDAIQPVTGPLEF